jgi:hypothetical protein
MLTDEQWKFIAARRASVLSPDLLEIKVFSGDVYARRTDEPKEDQDVALACDPDGNDRIDRWPSKGITLEQMKASDEAIERAFTTCGLAPCGCMAEGFDDDGRAIVAIHASTCRLYEPES